MEKDNVNMTKIPEFRDFTFTVGKVSFSGQREENKEAKVIELKNGKKWK